MTYPTEQTDSHSYGVTARERPWAFFVPKVLAVVMVIFGLPILVGGIWLLTLGGSFYYVLAGLGLLISALLLFMGRMTGVWVYVLTWAFTLVWALWEVGLNGWAQVPRLVAPTVILVLVLACIPLLRRRVSVSQIHSSRTTAAMAIFLALGIGSGALTLNPSQGQAKAQEAAAPATDTAPAHPLAPAMSSPTISTDTAAQIGPQKNPQTGALLTAAEQKDVGADWPAYGGTSKATRFSPLDQITPENVGKLQKVWEFHTGDLPNKATEGKYSPENTPLKVGNNLFICSPKDQIIAVDAKSGKERWRYDPKVPDDAIPYGATCRGISYYEMPGAQPGAPCATRVIEATLDARLIAIDAEDGKICADFGDRGSTDLAEGIGYTVPGWFGNVAAPVVVRGIVVVGAQVLDGQAEDAPSGVIRGYSADTGDLAWAWDMCKPDLTGLPAEGETYTRGTPNMWTSAAGDEQLGYVYVPLGNSAVDYHGGNRLDCENQYSSSLVALDVTTGREAWHFQTVHYDLWDYDLGSQPTLVDMPTDNGTVPAVIQASKQGEIYVLNRQTGESLFPVNEKDAPSGGVESENLAAQQPYSGYATLAKDRLQEKDMWGMTPLDQLWCRIQFRQADYQGEYTAPTHDRPYIEYPGYNGGSDWGSIAVDAEKGLLIANYNDMPNYNRLLTREEANQRGLGPITEPGTKHDNPQAGSPWAIEINAGWREATGLMCKQPPYGNIRAIDLKTGKTVWDTPLGQARENGPFGIPSMLPIKIGTPNNGGSVVTAGGLIFIAAATDNLIRAIDEKTGETLWTAPLPGGGQANPITFEVDGRQYVAIYPGGHHFMETPISDAVVAWALPEGNNG